MDIIVFQSNIIKLCIFLFVELYSYFYLVFNEKCHS